MESKRICGEIKIGTVMKPVRFGSWDLGRMGVGRGKTNHIQMTGQIQPNRRLDLFNRHISFANTSKLVVVCIRFFNNLDQTRRFSVYWKKKKQGTSSYIIEQTDALLHCKHPVQVLPSAGWEVRNVLYMFGCFKSF